jgi:hypothetical protein
MEKAFKDIFVLSRMKWTMNELRRYSWVRKNMLEACEGREILMTAAQKKKSFSLCEKISM